MARLRHKKARRGKNGRLVAVAAAPRGKGQTQLPEVDQVTGQKIPKSFVFARGKIPGPLRQLEHDLRKLMLPYTALRLKEKKRNNLKDFLNVAGPMGVSHFLILSNPKSVPHLRVAKTPQGPTLTFEIQEYSLATDVARSQLHPRCPKELFNNPPLIVLSGFGGRGQHLKVTVTVFQNIFPTIDVNTVKLSSCRRIVLLHYNAESQLIDLRHYSIRLQPVGITRRIRKLVQNNQVPNLGNLQDVSEFITRAGYGSESEAEDGAPTVDLVSDIDKVNRAAKKSAVKLQEIGPRMTLRLVKVELGLCAGDIIYSESVLGGKEASEAQQDSLEEDS